MMHTHETENANAKNEDLDDGERDAKPAAGRTRSAASAEAGHVEVPTPNHLHDDLDLADCSSFS